MRHNGVQRDNNTLRGTSRESHWEQPAVTYVIIARVRRDVPGIAHHRLVSRVSVSGDHARCVPPTWLPSSKGSL